MADLDEESTVVEEKRRALYRSWSVGFDWIGISLTIGSYKTRS